MAPPRALINWSVADKNTPDPATAIFTTRPDGNVADRVESAYQVAFCPGQFTLPGLLRHRSRRRLVPLTENAQFPAVVDCAARTGLDEITRPSPRKRIDTRRAGSREVARRDESVVLIPRRLVGLIKTY